MVSSPIENLRFDQAHPNSDPPSSIGRHGQQDSELFRMRIMRKQNTPLDLPISGHRRVYFFESGHCD